LLYTDGVTEAEDRNRNLFQDVRLKEALIQRQGSSLNALLDGIWSVVEAFTGGVSQSDDVTLLVVCYRGPAENDGNTLAVS
jgi:sigma-B regulation protein RsbU (phosphoserine phosphatase)